MTAPDFTGLANLKSPSSRASTKRWSVPTTEDFHPGVVTAFDQTLSNTGAVILVNDPKSMMDVVEVEMFRPPEVSGTGHQKSLDQALWLRGQIDKILHRASPYAAYHRLPQVVVHEMPPMGGKVARQGESSLLAALVVQSRCHDLGFNLEPMVNSQRAKKMICGNARVEKKEAHNALKEWASFMPGFAKVTNEHTRDAVLVALTHLWKG